MATKEIIVDTNVISYFIRGTTQAELYRPHTERRILTISFISVGELYFWAEGGAWGDARRRNLDAYISGYDIIPSDDLIARYYGKISAECRKKGRPISTNDAWIAACAARHGYPLLTHNRKHFEHIDFHRGDLRSLTRLQSERTPAYNNQRCCDPYKGSGVRGALLAAPPQPTPDAAPLSACR